MLETFRTWDGKSTAPLKAVASGLVVADHPQLIAACRSDDTTVARAASWVLKAAYEKGAGIAFPADLLALDLHWEVALHLLQSVQYAGTDISPEIVRSYLSHKKPMVRAWALDAYVRIGAVDAERMITAGLEDSAASVRARARNLAAIGAR